MWVQCLDSAGLATTFSIRCRAHNMKQYMALQRPCFKESPQNAKCIKKSDDSLNSAIHIAQHSFAAPFIDAQAQTSIARNNHIIFLVKHVTVRPTPSMTYCNIHDHALVCRVYALHNTSAHHHGNHNIGWYTYANWSSNVKTLRCMNDPSAGSPTETLLRLLLPLSDKVH